MRRSDVVLVAHFLKNQGWKTAPFLQIASKLKLEPRTAKKAVLILNKLGGIKKIKNAPFVIPWLTESDYESDKWDRYLKRNKLKTKQTERKQGYWGIINKTRLKEIISKPDLITDKLLFDVESYAQPTFQKGILVVGSKKISIPEKDRYHHLFCVQMFRLPFGQKVTTDELVNTLKLDDELDIKKQGKIVYDTKRRLNRLIHREAGIKEFFGYTNDEYWINEFWR